MLVEQVPINCSSSRIIATIYRCEIIRVMFDIEHITIAHRKRFNYTHIHKFILKLLLNFLSSTHCRPRIIANGLQLGEVADFGALTFNLTLMFI